MALFLSVISSWTYEWSAWATSNPSHKTALSSLLIANPSTTSLSLVWFSLFDNSLLMRIWYALSLSFHSLRATPPISNSIAWCYPWAVLWTSRRDSMIWWRNSICKMFLSSLSPFYRIDAFFPKMILECMLPSPFSISRSKNKNYINKCRLYCVGILYNMTSKSEECRAKLSTYSIYAPLVNNLKFRDDRLLHYTIGTIRHLCKNSSIAQVFALHFYRGV